jgi:hypothetical protein
MTNSQMQSALVLRFYVALVEEPEIEVTPG